MRLLRCRACGEAFPARRGTAFCNTTRAEEQAEDGINHLDAGWSVRATARLAQVATTTVAQLWRMAGHHAQRLPEQPVHGRRPRAVEVDEQGRCVKKSQSAVPSMRVMPRAICGTIRRWQPLASSWSLASWANVRTLSHRPEGKTPRAVSTLGIDPQCSPRPLPATRQPL